MLRKLLKCEYRYWATAPWFFTLLFSFTYLFVAISDGMNYYHYSYSALSYFAFPLLIFLGTLISVVNWKRERQSGGTTTALTMPATSQEYLVSKYVSVFLGQLLFSFIVVLLSTILLVSVSRLHHWDMISAALLTIVMIALGSTINFLSTLMNRRLNIYFISGLLVVAYHFVYYFMFSFWLKYFWIYKYYYVVMGSVLIVLCTLMAWRLSRGYISRAEDIP